MVKNVGIVISDYYKDISIGLEQGAIKFCNEAKINFKKFYVPGALEIPTAIRLASQHFSGFVALGCVIRGETSHYETVSTESSRALVDLGLCDICIGNGILTVENYTQAMIRADMSGQNKGGEAALASLMLIKVKNKFSKV